ncbi:ribonuclease J [Paenibacillus sp. CGMCC 1.16610]|uniref:Ribonuclease J n=1 Tax=Paenibacillus anseongense TaxID=2682845 RepID=A0ABW9ULF1_9BACL|nr:MULTISPECIES: ribonuclease J [Paenibacillus]MBA2940231.1 ribonuclease J [Paenibacillus sp. CGMCC 1.16610]MVQ38685.1 RNase J family beta-CASP ribonuclease [Paenibacillus anseongense]
MKATQGVSKVTKLDQQLSVFSLGGINEIGKNMYVVQYGNDIVVIDCGSKFPDETLLGVDLIVPDITYLIENSDKVRALVITHGHEDHIGGIPYIRKQINVPIYATRLTIGLIEVKLREAGLLAGTKLIEINSNSTVDLGSITSTFFKTNHSIPDCLGVVFHTPEGAVVHTGDFKFDLTPVNNQYPDIHKMADIGSKGVMLLLSESTNAERPGYTPSESHVGKHLEEAFHKAKQKVFIATFASNVHRLQQVIDAAQATNRQLALLGRSMVNVVKIASELGYLTVPDGMLVEAGEIGSLASERIAILCTGSQGEPMAALSRLSRNNYRNVEIHRGDTVILSSSPIPGNERNVSKTVDNLFSLGAEVIYGSSSVTGMHVSGHGSQEELKLMLTLMKPKYFIPIHGEYRMLHQHRILAESVGVEPANIFILNNGDVVDIKDEAATQSRKVTAGNTLVDGLGDVGNIVLRDRKQLSEDGILIVVLLLSKTDGKILAGPDIISRGFVYVRESEDLIDRASILAADTVNRLQTGQEPLNQWNVLKINVKEVLGRFFYEKTGRRPVILTIITEF